MRKAYNTIVRSPERFIGHWADATELIKPGAVQTLRLTLPEADGGYHISDGAYSSDNCGCGELRTAAHCPQKMAA